MSKKHGQGPDIVLIRWDYKKKIHTRLVRILATMWRCLNFKEFIRQPNEYITLIVRTLADDDNTHTTKKQPNEYITLIVRTLSDEDNTHTTRDRPG